ncbi:MAG: GNAT family N-acetyltransferase [Bosea sp.]|nr:GNAT family N-acetyltransferase [Bosea sp. (in: a-proteobacteria)]
MSTETTQAHGPASAPRPPLFPDLTRDDVFRLETRRLWLRWPRHGDIAALRAFAGLREVAEMTGSWPHPLPEGEAERRIFAARKANATGVSLFLALTPRSKPNLQVGWVCVTATPNPDEAELGYMLHPHHSGQGLMAEAVQAVLDTVFSYTAVERVTAWSRVVNPASRRVLEKCGFRHIGTALSDLPARGGMHSCDEFMLDSGAWAALVNWPRQARAAQADGLGHGAVVVAAARLSAETRLRDEAAGGLSAPLALHDGGAHAR